LYPAFGDAPHDLCAFTASSAFRLIASGLPQHGRPKKDANFGTTRSIFDKIEQHVSSRSVVRVPADNFLCERSNVMLQRMKNFLKDEQGQDLVEYALLLVFLALAAISILPTLGSSVNKVFSESNSALTVGS